MPNSWRTGFARSSAIFAAACAFVALSGLQAQSQQAAPAIHELNAEEQKWLDRRIPDDERAALNAARGYAPGDPGAQAFWIGADAPKSLESLRGNVVVIQSWTNATEPGRSALSRTLDILKTVDHADLHIVALHTPEGHAAAKGYLNLRSIGVPVLVDTDGAFCDNLGVYKRPVTIILDRDGAVRYAGVAMAGLKPAVERLLLEEAPDPGSAAPPTVPARGADSAPSKASRPERRPTFPPIGGSVAANDLRGKKGPPIRVGQWMTPEPRTDGKVVMVEFWATWCGPCLKSIPHLNKLQDKHKDTMVIIGVSDEDSSKIRRFMQSNKFTYTVASDQRRSMIGTVAPRGIPHAIIMCPQGIVRWQGNPLSLQDQTVEQIIAASDIKSSSEPKRWKS